MLQHTLKKIFFSFSAYYPKNPDLTSTESTFYVPPLPCSPTNSETPLRSQS